MGSTWVGLGGYVKQIAVGRNLDGREEVFAIGGDNTVWALMEAAVNDAWTDSNWFQVTNDKVQALAVVLNTDFGGSSAYGKMTLALIQSNNSLVSVQQLPGKRRLELKTYPDTSENFRSLGDFGSFRIGCKLLCGASQKKKKH